ncbi:MAG: uroporphyrinogen decarboxylase family protein [Phycisphaerae bacterium]|nr:uroporphyrinogen decarboxylase family protein [Phycisphaerae bacterium]
METSREIVDALMRRKPAPRMGIMENIWGDTIEKWITQGYPLNDDGKIVDIATHFGHDLVGVGGWFDLLPLKGFSEIVEETDEWKVVRNGAGASLKWWKNKSGTPEHVDFRMTSREIWDRDYRPHVLELDRGRLDVEGTKANLTTRREQGLWTSYGHLFIWENMRQSLGDICLYESMALDKEWIHDYNRVHTDFFKTHMCVLLEEAGKPDGAWMYEDMGYRDNIFCSPAMFAEMIFPYFREMVEFYHSYDLPVTLHTCGLVEPVLDMIVDVGFDAVHPMEVKAGNDPLRIARKYADKLTLIGGLDERILETHDRGLIRREVTKLIQGMKDAGASFVFASDHSISTNVDYQDYLYAVEVFREQCAY